MTKLLAAIRKELSADVVGLALAVILLTVAVWPVLHRVALIVPALVILYLALPSRAPFLTRVPPEPPARRKR